MDKCDSPCNKLSVLENEVKSLRELLDTKVLNIDRATEKALAANDKRLEGMNEFRDTLKDQAATFLTKSDYDAKHDILKDQISKLEISRVELHAKADQKTIDERFKELHGSTNWTRIFLIITALMAATAILIDIFKH